MIPITTFAYIDAYLKELYKTEYLCKPIGLA